MNNKFIFDVDGTLTPSRGVIDPKFHDWFLEFTRNNKCWLVTGSDYPKTLEQLGKDICESVVTSYNCNGNDTWFKGKRVNSSNWKLPEDAHEWLSEQLAESDFSIRTGLHFEHRTGMCNFSIVGRNATPEQRQAYVDYETWNGDRRHIADQFNQLFKGLQATVGGETGIDIAPKGMDKSQILGDFDKDDNIYFFGDRMDEGGNDYPLAQLVKYPRHVRDWQNTWEWLSWLQEQGVAS